MYNAFCICLVNSRGSIDSLIFIYNAVINKIQDLSQELSKTTEVKAAYCKLYPVNGYGDPKILRSVIEQEKPDALVHFTDPRYWIWLYQMENEIRQQCPLVFYTIWDDLPYPMWNREFYRSDDMLLCISKQTKNIVENVLRDHPKEDIHYVKKNMIL